MDVPPDTLLSIAEAAEVLSVSRSTFHRLAAEDPTFPPRVPIRGQVRYRDREIRGWIDGQQRRELCRAYSTALRAEPADDAALRQAAARLQLRPEEVSLHQLVLAEHERLNQAAADVEAAQQAIDQAGGRGPVDASGRLYPEEADAHRDRFLRLQRAKHAARQHRAIEAVFFLLLGRPEPHPRLVQDARGRLPRDILSSLRDIEARALAEEEDDDDD